MSGHGKVTIDGEMVALSSGDWLKIAPAAKRQFFAGEDSGLSFVCIQEKKNSLGSFTVDDANEY